MELQYTGVVRVTVDMQKEYKKPKHIATDFFLETKHPLDIKAYQNPDSTPNKEGCKALAECFIQGLIGVIHVAHQQGYRDSAENLRDMIEKITKGFATVADVKPGEF